ncbi:hypothetical protein G7Z17_g4018 [Cylindrodendrum hubeiense]|uniref:Rhodopsin domain-containing protein n=1 Tax=Cylindrodendrum hubeiense TaxID=595255 RepID=A0A9P5HJV5_9HYPO|nr:hypothetical protein G7Z17_g4018 [Cylindrodendrum hubeiense]
MATQGESADASLHSKKSLIITVISSVLAVTFLIFSMRMYTRAVLLRNFGIDDWCSVLAFLLTLASGLVVTLNTRNGLGAHQSTLSDEEFMEYMKTFYITIVFYNLALAAIKMTFLFQYYRAMTVHRLKKAYIAALVIVGAWSLSQILLNALACRPVSAFWDKEAGGSCIPSNPSWYINAAGNIATDILILLLPLPIIRKLQLGRRQKYVLTSIFCLGFFKDRSYARHQDSRGQLNLSKSYAARGVELNHFPSRSVRSSGSKDALYDSQKAVVIRTDISQQTQTMKEGGELIIQHISIKGGDNNRSRSPVEDEGQDSQHGRSIDLNKGYTRTTQRLEVKEFT